MGPITKSIIDEVEAMEVLKAVVEGGRAGFEQRSRSQRPPCFSLPPTRQSTWKILVVVGSGVDFSFFHPRLQPRVIFSSPAI